MKKIYAVIVVIVLVLLFAWGFSAKKEVGLKQPITIGAVISLTGPAAQFGEYTKKGMELAVKEINDKGGMDGRPVKVVYEDDATDPKTAVSAFNKLLSVNKVQAVIGGLWDFVAQPLLPLALSNKITFITPSQFRIEGGFEFNNYSFTMMTDFNKVIRTTTSLLQKPEVKKIAVVHFKSTFGTEIAKTVTQVAKELSKEAVIDESYGSIDDNDFKTTVLKLKQQKVDTVFLDMVDADTFNFLKRAKELDFRAKLITYVGSYDALTKDNEYLLEGVTIINWDVASAQFVEKFQQTYGITPAKSANRAYDAVYMLAEAIAKSEKTEDVASYISSHDFSTVNGKIQFLPTHQVSSIPVEIDVFKDGKLVKTGN